MIFSSQTWFRYATKFMPRDRADWLTAMQTELQQISSPADRNAFAFGCFRAALLEFARSRKGLSYLARIGGASLLFIASCAAGFIWNSKVGSQPETLAVGKIISILCLSYMCGAALLLASLKGLKIYSIIGFSVASLGWIFCLISRPSYEYLSSGFLTAISFEAAGIMAGLFIAAVYLSWLYTPAIHDV